MNEDEFVEKLAILIAEANNGGKWATHYVEAHKEVWRERAKNIISMVDEWRSDTTTSMQPH